MRLTRWNAFACCISMVSVMTGCVTATVQQVREASTGMRGDDSIVVLGRRHRPTPGETELDFVACISKNMGKGSEGVTVIGEQAFMDAMFPWFEPRTAPMNTSDLPEIMSQPALADRLEEIGLRYLVWIDGNTQRTASSGSMTCSITTAGAGCFGFLSWENDSSYEASIWDVRTGAAVGKVSSDATGTSYMPAVVVPVPLIARVKSQACNTLAGQLKSFLIGDKG